MATYYGYAERDVQNQIDWSKVGKDVSDMLATEVQLREEKKAAIEKATQEYGEELSNQPVGQDAEANKILAEFADSAQELRLMQDRLLRSGSIKLKDYNMMRQNTTSGTGNMFDFADEYNERFDLFKKRLDGLGPTGKKSSEIEAWRVEKLGTFATFRNTKPTFNPATGELSLSEMVDDGNGQMVPKEGLSFSSLRNMLYEQTDQFEVLPAAQKISDSFADTYKKVVGKGRIKSIDDVRNLPDYENTLNTFVNAELEGNPNAATSILVDYLDYSMDDIDMRWNEEQQTYIPNLTAKQKKEAADALKQAVEANFGREEEYRSPEYAPQYVTNKRDKDKQDIASMNMIAYLYGGDAGEKAQAVQYFGGLNKDILKIDARTNKIKVYKTDGSIVDLDASKDLSEFAKSATELTNVTDVSRAISKADMYNKFKDEDFKQDATAEITYKELGETKDEKTQREKLEVRQKFTREVDKELEPFLTDNYLNQNVRDMEEEYRKTFKAELEPILTQYGIDITDEYRGGDEMIRISAPAKKDGKEVIVAAIDKSMELYPESNYKDAMETIKAVIEQYTTINEKNSRLEGGRASEAAAAAGTGNNQAP